LDVWETSLLYKNKYSNKNLPCTVFTDSDLLSSLGDFGRSVWGIFLEDDWDLEDFLSLLLVS